MTRDAEIPERPNVSRAPLVPRRTGAKGEEQETRENQNGGRTCALHVDTYRILTPVIRLVGLEQTNPVRLSVPGISPQSHVTPLSYPFLGDFSGLRDTCADMTMTRIATVITLPTLLTGAIVLVVTEWSASALRARAVPRALADRPRLLLAPRARAAARAMVAKRSACRPRSSAGTSSTT